jgi:aryl-alcohol dehydrogenase-like predicted oxidoreductase
MDLSLVCFYRQASKMFDFSYEKTLESVDNSLRLLQVDYVDIIQGTRA